MLVRLRDIEPFNVSPVDDTLAAKFTSHLTGGESFAWNGPTQPRCMMFYRVDYDYPRKCVGHALLFPTTYDEFVAAGRAVGGTAGDVFDRLAIGSIRIEYGGEGAGAVVEASQSVPKP